MSETKQLNTEAIVHEAFVKCTNVVWSFRTWPVQSSSGKLNRWFQLELENNPLARTFLDTTYKTEPVVIEVYSSQAGSATSMLIERWTISTDAAIGICHGTGSGSAYTGRLANSGNGSSTGSGSSSGSRLSAEGGALLKKLTLLVRTLCSQVVMLPTHRLLRAFKAQPIAVWRMSCKLIRGTVTVGGPPGTTHTAAPVDGNATCQQLPGSWSMSGVTTTCGVFRIRVDHLDPAKVTELEAVARASCPSPVAPPRLVINDSYLEETAVLKSAASTPLPTRNSSQRLSGGDITASARANVVSDMGRPGHGAAVRLSGPSANERAPPSFACANTGAANVHSTSHSRSSSLGVSTQKDDHARFLNQVRNSAPLSMPSSASLSAQNSTKAPIDSTGRSLPISASPISRKAWGSKPSTPAAGVIPASPGGIITAATLATSLPKTTQVVLNTSHQELSDVQSTAAGTTFATHDPSADHTFKTPRDSLIAAPFSRVNLDLQGEGLGASIDTCIHSEAATRSVSTPATAVSSTAAAAGPDQAAYRPRPGCILPGHHAGSSTTAPVSIPGSQQRVKSMADMQVVYNFPDNPAQSRGNALHPTLRVGFPAARGLASSSHGPSGQEPPHLHGSAPAAPRGMLGQALEAHLANLKAKAQTGTTSAATPSAENTINNMAPVHNRASADGTVQHGGRRGSSMSRLSKPQGNDGDDGDGEKDDVCISKRTSLESRASEEVVDADGTRVPRRSMDIVLYRGRVDDSSGHDPHVYSVASRHGSLMSGGNAVPGMALPVCGSYTRGRAAWWRTVSGTSPQLPFAFTPAVQSGLSTAASGQLLLLSGTPATVSPSWTPLRTPGTPGSAAYSRSMVQHYHHQQHSSSGNANGGLSHGGGANSHTNSQIGFKPKSSTVIPARDVSGLAFARRPSWIEHSARVGRTHSTSGGSASSLEAHSYSGATSLKLTPTAGTTQMFCNAIKKSSMESSIMEEHGDGSVSVGSATTILGADIGTLISGFKPGQPQPAKLSSKPDTATSNVDRAGQNTVSAASWLLPPQVSDNSSNAAGTDQTSVFNTDLGLWDNSPLDLPPVMLVTVPSESGANFLGVARSGSDDINEDQDLPFLLDLSEHSDADVDACPDFIGNSASSRSSWVKAIKPLCTVSKDQCPYGDAVGVQGGLKLPARDVAVGYLLQHLEQQQQQVPLAGKVHDVETVTQQPTDAEIPDGATSAAACNDNGLAVGSSDTHSAGNVAGSDSQPGVCEVSVSGVKVVPVAEVMQHEDQQEDSACIPPPPIMAAKSQPEMLTCKEALTQLAAVEQALAALLATPGRYM